MRFELLAHPSFLLLPILWRRLFLSDECLQCEFSVPQLKGKSKAPAAPVQFDFENVGATAVTMTDDLMLQFRALHSWGGPADRLRTATSSFCSELATP